MAASAYTVYNGSDVFSVPIYDFVMTTTTYYAQRPGLLAQSPHQKWPAGIFSQP